MKILIAHNRYRQRGGEDVVFENEARLLSSAGHDVKTLVLSNEMISSYSDKIFAMLGTVENPSGMAAISQCIEEFRPDLVHVHNFFPLLSPGIYRVCRGYGIPVVQTLHNYRTICAATTLLRNGKICELCVKGSALWGVMYRCYHGSIVGSAATARMIAVHRKRQTWTAMVDRYIALSEFGRSIFVAAGFPKNRIDVKPNFIEDPGAPEDAALRTGILYVGRLRPEKGVPYLIEACARLGYPLRIAGEGPELAALRRSAPPNVTFLGHLSHKAVFDELRHAAVTVIPSIWYEPFAIITIESFACATPVIASRVGALAEIIEDGVTGFLVPPADPAALAERISQVIRDPIGARRLGQTARHKFMECYTPEVNLKLLESSYEKALNSFHP